MKYIQLGVLPTDVSAVNTVLAFWATKRLSVKMSHDLLTTKPLDDSTVDVSVYLYVSVGYIESRRQATSLKQ